MKTKIQYGLVGLALCAQTSFAAYYETLPKGVRAVVLKQVQTSKIQSSFTDNKQEVQHQFKERITAKTLEPLGSGVRALTNELKKVSPEAYENLVFAEYEASAVAQVKVQGLGGAYGITNRFMVYAGFPYYSAEVDIDVNRTGGNSYQQVQDSIQTGPNSSPAATIFNSLAGQLPDASGEFIQSILVDVYGYKPIGNWKGKGMGDIELGSMYRLTNWKDAGIAVKGGVVLPTGRQDDPDALQDLAFGDGQTDIFAEVGGGMTFLRGKLDLDLLTRYTYQFSSNKDLRIINNSEFPLSKEKGTFKEKLGNKWDLTFSSSYKFLSWLSVSADYIYSTTGKTKYESPYEKANTVMAENTDKESHSVKGTLKFSSVQPYLSGKFVAPMEFALSGQKYFAGRNIPKYTAFDLEFRLFF